MTNEERDKKAKMIQHIIEEGSCSHVMWWDSYGGHCSEPDCEVNKTIAREKAENAYHALTGE